MGTAGGVTVRHAITMMMMMVSMTTMTIGLLAGAPCVVATA
jgi:hypothetical protein